MTTTETKARIDPPGTGSPDDRAHYVLKANIGRAVVEGGRVMSLCGVMFEPVRDPERFPVCEDCKRILAEHPDGEVS